MSTSDMIKSISVSIVLLMAVMSGCAKERIEVARPGRMTPDAERVLTVLRERLDSIRTLRASGTLFIWARGERVTDIAVAVDPPGRMRLEAMDAVADVTMAAGLDGKRGWIWFPAEDKLYRGRASRKNLNKVFDIDWKAGDLIHAMTGTVDVDESDFLERSVSDPMTYLLDDKRVAVRMDKKQGLPMLFVRYRNADDHASPLYEVRFEAYHDVDGVKFPHRIVAHVPGRGYRVVFAYDHVELNGEIDENVFKGP